MAFALNDHWVWDHWILTSDDQLDLFFLRASKALLEPGRRHARASIGHARSFDEGKTWELLPDALVREDRPAFDDRATWTGSAIHHPDGFVRLFYTGNSWEDGGRFVQRIGWADSKDGIEFHRTCQKPIEPDPKWYECDDGTNEVAWRDPFVFFHDGEWHMLITAKLRDGSDLDRGTIGHATSKDLDNWIVQPPLTGRTNFGHLECAQYHFIDGKHYLVFSCDAGMRKNPEGGNVWFAEGESPLGPFDVDGAKYAVPEYLYAAQMFQDTEGNWLFTGFDSFDDATFKGTIPDPIPWEQLELK